jgi:segregation and condensation protein B
MRQEELDRTIQALLFTSDKPLAGGVIAGVMEIKEKEVEQAVERINSHLHETGSPVSVRQIAGGYEFLTLPEYAPHIKKLYKNRFMTRLSRPSLEVLAIIAYKQPITKQEVESIRGVNSDGVYHTLLERKLIKIAGRKEAPGRPLLYSTTKEFLQYLGINSMDDLPKIEEIKSILEKDEFVESWEDRIEVAKNQAQFQFDPEEGKQAPAVKVTTLEEDLKAMEKEEKIKAESQAVDDADKDEKEAEEVETEEEGRGKGKDKKEKADSDEVRDDDEDDDDKEDDDEDEDGDDEDEDDDDDEEDEEDGDE